MIYVSASNTTGNTLTQGYPSGTGTAVQIVGAAVSANIMIFKPELTRIILK